MKEQLAAIAIIVVLGILLALPALAQEGPPPGCGCTMPTELIGEPPTPTATPFSDLGEPPRFPSRVWLPLIGGAA